MPLDIHGFFNCLFLELDTFLIGACLFVTSCNAFIMFSILLLISLEFEIV